MGQTQLVYFLVNGGCLCSYIGKIEKKETLVVEPWQVQVSKHIFFQRIKILWREREKIL